MTRPHENLAIELRDAVLWVRIDRPKSRNALSRRTLAELGATFAEAAANHHVKAAVISGAGEQAFAAGGDLKELVAVRTEEGAGEIFDLANQAFDRIRRFPVPVVAALNGVALGGGAELAAACDFRIAAAHARIGFIQGRLNISTGFGGGTDLMRLLGPVRGLSLALSAEDLDVHQAQALGLIDEIVQPGETLGQCIDRFLRPVLRLTPEVIRAYKAMALAERLGLTYEERRRIERDWFVNTWVRPEHWQAVEARQTRAK
jgi:enoyl-CoA hydratase